MHPDGWVAMKHVLLALLICVAGCRAPVYGPAPAPDGADEAPAQVAAQTDGRAAALTAEQVAILEAEATDYRLGAGDVIELYAMDVIELNREYVIGPDGKITVPGVGVVDLDGFTREQAAGRIGELLRPFYRDPAVHIIVTAYNNNRVFVLGEVRKPGQYNFSGRPFLLAALARAEGLTDRADMRGCTIIRGRGTLIEIDLYDLLRKGDRTLNIPLLPEDAVYVKADEDHTFYVLGEVANPGMFPRGKAMDVVRAIALAGGNTRDARLGDVRVVRRIPGQQPVVLSIDLAGVLAGKAADNPAVQTGDIVYVPRRGVATFNYYLGQLTPSINTVLLGATLHNVFD